MVTASLAAAFAGARLRRRSGLQRAARRGDWRAVDVARRAGRAARGARDAGRGCARSPPATSATVLADELADETGRADCVVVTAALRPGRARAPSRSCARSGRRASCTSAGRARTRRRSSTSWCRATSTGGRAMRSRSWSELRDAGARRRRRRRLVRRPRGGAHRRSVGRAHGLRRGRGPGRRARRRRLDGRPRRRAAAAPGGDGARRARAPARVLAVALILGATGALLVAGRAWAHPSLLWQVARDVVYAGGLVLVGI